MKKASGGENSEVPADALGRLCVAFPLQFLGCIRLAVLPLGGSAECASALEISSGLRGPSPQAFTSSGGLGLLPGA